MLVVVKNGKVFAVHHDFCNLAGKYPSCTILRVPNDEAEQYFSGVADFSTLDDPRNQGITCEDVTSNPAPSTSSITAYTGTLSAAGWSGTEAPYSQTVSITGITADDEPIIDVVMSGNYATDSIRNEEWGYIYRAVTGTNSITFYAIEKPTVDLPFTAKVVK